MKKKLKIFIFSMFVFLLVACSNNSTLKTNANYYCSYKKTIYINPLNNNLKIEYPIFNDEKLSNVNNLVKNKITAHIEDTFEENAEKVELQLISDVTYCDNGLISITFSGEANVNGAAHPTYEFVTLNIDVKTNTLIKLTDKYYINEKFIDMYISKFKEQIPSDLSVIIDSYSKAQLLDYFNNADTYDSTIKSYYTKNGVGISFRATYVVGDNLKIDINKKDIERFIKK